MPEPTIKMKKDAFVLRMRSRFGTPPLSIPSYRVNNMR